MFIEFMFQERRWRLSRERLATFLGVRISDEPRLLHYLAYGDTKPPHRPHDTRFPSDEEVSVLLLMVLKYQFCTVNSCINT